jgi:hypothetical protein
MKRTLLIISMIPLLTVGCTTAMWKQGFATVTTAQETYFVAGNRPPVAAKDTKGNVTIEYDAVRYRLNMNGNQPESSKWTLWRMTNMVSLSKLESITNLFSPDPRGTFFPPAADEEAFVAAGQAMPLMDIKMTDKSALLFPPYECVLNYQGLLWYVPPRHAGEPARGALLSKETTKNSRAYIPVKIALTPVTIVEDVFVLPATALVYLLFAIGNPTV